MATSELSTSESVAAISEALANAQGAFGHVARKKTAKIQMKSGGTFSYSYADLADVLAAIRDTLKDNGLAVVQPIVVSEGRTLLITRVTHTSGEWIESSYPLTMHASPQEMGSAITYARRYTLTAMLGIAADDDDDAQLAQTAKPQKVEQSSVRGSAEPAHQQDVGGETGRVRSLPVEPPAPSTDELAAKPLILKLRRDLRSMAAKNKVELPDLNTLTHEQLQELETDLKKAVAQ